MTWSREEGITMINAAVFIRLAQTTALFLFVFLAVGLSGCQTTIAKERFAAEQARGAREIAVEQWGAEKQQRQNLEGMNKKLTERVKELEDSLRQCQSKLNTVENQTKTGLLSEVEGLKNTMEQMKQTMQQAEQKARAQGMLAVWESLCIEIEPTQDEGWVYNDYYLTTRICVRTSNGGERTIFSHKVQTRREEAPVVKTFSSMMDVLTLVTLYH